ncbi:MBL fold metallo-hydrolase [Balneolales bacterium ANBcel1]|nr:MBL fold metallo-hydrolase [Balneolales bacterium ANBcel1]
MDIGGFRAEQLSEGIFEISSGGSIQKIRNHQQEKTALASVQRVGLDPVLIDTGNTLVLLDAGLGMGLDSSEPDRNTSNLLTNLEIFGYRPGDIRHVILSHLHYDHVAGLSYTDRAGNVTASLPNARIYVQQAEWDAAMHSLENRKYNREVGYDPDDLYRLVADGRFVFLQKERQEILDGFTVIRTGGHTPGHQIVRIRSGRETAYYCGDLIPSEFHLNHYVLSRVDTDITKARKARMLLMQQAYHDQATLLFYHSVYQKAGKVTRDKNRKFVLRNK